MEYAKSYEEKNVGRAIENARKPSDRYALFVSWSDGNAAHRNREECRPRPFDDPVVGSPLGLRISIFGLAAGSRIKLAGRPASRIGSSD
jgi:hypothetical protein